MNLQTLQPSHQVIEIVFGFKCDEILTNIQMRKRFSLFSSEVDEGEEDEVEPTPPSFSSQLTDCASRPLPTQMVSNVSGVSFYDQADLTGFFSAMRREIVRSPGDGLCWFYTVLRCMTEEHNICLSVPEIRRRVDNEIAKNSAEYMAFSNIRSVEEMERLVANFWKKRNFLHPIMDTLVMATINALNLHVTMYQEGPQHQLQVAQIPARDAQHRVHVLFYRGVHYDAVIPMQGARSVQNVSTTGHIEIV